MSYLRVKDDLWVNTDQVVMVKVIATDDGGFVEIYLNLTREGRPVYEKLRGEDADKFLAWLKDNEEPLSERG